MFLHRPLGVVGLLAILLAALMPSPAYAYLDPATGSSLIQAGYYIFYATLTYFVLFFRHAKAMFGALGRRLFGSKKETQPSADPPSAPEAAEKQLESV